MNELLRWHSLLPDPIQISEDLLAREDWAESWKQFFHCLHASERLVVKPSWEELPANLQNVPYVIEIDPGMSFGTGRHGTTLACLKFLDYLAGDPPAGRSLVDVGCGSGILEIAAAKLGYCPITAFDVDPAAVECARANLSANELDTDITCVEADVAQLWEIGTFDTVVANMETSVLFPNTLPISRLVSTDPNGRLIIAGILENEFSQAVERFHTHGFILLEAMTLNGWRSGLLARSTSL